MSGGAGARDTRDAGGAATVRVTVNGTPRELPVDTTVAGLLATLGSPGRPCAVEIDRVLVPGSTHAARRLAEGEAIEIVGFVGGG